MLQELQKPLVALFIAAPEDALFIALREEYALAGKESILLSWSEQPLTGEVFRQTEILEHLWQADLIVLLVSLPFFAATGRLVLEKQPLHWRIGDEMDVMLFLFSPLDDRKRFPRTLRDLLSPPSLLIRWNPSADIAFHDCLQVVSPVSQQSVHKLVLEFPQEKMQSARLRHSLKLPWPFSWSWKRAVAALPGSLLLSITASLAAVLLYGLFIWYSIGPVIGLFYMLLLALPRALPVGLLTGVLSGMLGAAIYGCFGDRPADQNPRHTHKKQE